MKLWHYFDVFFQIAVLRKPETVNFADINDSEIVKVKKQ